MELYIIALLCWLLVRIIPLITACRLQVSSTKRERIGDRRRTAKTHTTSGAIFTVNGNGWQLNMSTITRNRGCANMTANWQARTFAVTVFAKEKGSGARTLEDGADFSCRFQFCTNESSCEPSQKTPPERHASRVFHTELPHVVVGENLRGTSAGVLVFHRRTCKHLG